VKNRVKKVTKAVKEFSRFAQAYDHYNIIQSEVAKHLVSRVPYRNYRTIVDIGAGSGEIYRNLCRQEIICEHFIALDSSVEMLKLHPEALSVEKVCADFNLPETFEKLEVEKRILLLSSSALQWSRDLDVTLSRLSALSTEAYFAIFTSNTFKTLHRYAGIDSPIYSGEVLQRHIDTYFPDASYEVRNYRLYFESVYRMLRYIKQSGVSGGEKRLRYRETKALMKAYPLNYLEFEVLFVEVQP